MTTPLADKLGDFTQVQLGPNIPVPIMNGVPGVMVTLANQDLTNTITIARRNSFQQNASNTATIPPLGSITVDASKTIWALAPADTLPLLIFPGGGSWAPSPAQIAAQMAALGLATAANQVAQNTTIPNNIAAAGVPLLSLSSFIADDTAGHAIAAAGTLTLGPYTGWTQHSYEIFLQFTAAASSTFPFYTVTLVWTSTTTGNIVKTDSFNTIGSLAGTLWTIGYGPLGGQSLQIVITNNDTVSVNVNTIAIAQNSRAYTEDLWSNAWNGATMPAVPGFVSGPATRAPSARLLLGKNASLAASASSSHLLMPLWSGALCHLAFQGQGSNNWTIKITNSFTGQLDFQLSLSGANFSDKQWIPSRSPYDIQITNGGSVTGNYNVEVMGQQ